MSPEAYLEMADTESRHWWFSGRRAILASIISGFRLPTNAEILEIGSGTGGNLQMLAQFGRVSAMEMNATARMLASEKTQGRFDIREGCCPSHIPFVDEKFDLICLFDVLEHIDEDVGALTELRRLLKPSGKVVITVPAYSWLWGPHDEFLHHKRRYTAKELRYKVTLSGFHPIKMTYFNTFLFPLAAVVRIKERILDSQVASGASIPPRPINNLFRAFFGAERLLLKKICFPFGVSLLCIIEFSQP